MPPLNQLILHFNRQVDEVQPEGYILQGSVVRRKLQRRVGTVLKTYGPYYLWTRKIKGKTVTVALTDEQARIIRQAINRNRELEQRLDRLRSLSEQIIIAVGPCVVRRKRTPNT
jgi:DNA-binding transcriptional regulator of glucitol operon